MITNLKSSNRHIEAVADVPYKKIYLSASSLKNGEKTVLSFTVRQNRKTYRLSCQGDFPHGFCEKREAWSA